MDTVLSPDAISPAIFPADLRPLQGRADAPMLLDVRRAARFAESKQMLPGARHCPPEQLEVRLADLAARQLDRRAVVYCVYGHAVSQTAAALLRAHGWDARYLQGGFEGGEPGVDPAALIDQLRAQALPRITKRADLGVTGETPSRWVTRERPKIDRIACPWLLRRFVDRDADFLYVPTAEVFGAAKANNAVAYDIPGAPITHDGALCSFDAVLAAFDLNLPALDLLAGIVRGADTDQLALAPQSAGLLATSLGFSRLHAHDDQAMLAAMLPVYDALYAWCCERVAGVNESHHWNPQP